MALGTKRPTQIGYEIDTIAEATAELEAYTNITLTNGATAVGAGNGSPTPSYYREGNIVYLRGGIKHTPTGTPVVVGTLPAGYAPRVQCTFPLMVNTVATIPFRPINGYVRFDTNGNITVSSTTGGSNATNDYYLDECSFRCADAQVRPAVPTTVGDLISNSSVLLTSSLGETTQTLTLGTNWTGTVTGHRDPFGAWHMSGVATTGLARASGDTIGSMTGITSSGRQSFLCYVTGATGTQVFAQIDAVYNVAGKMDFVTMHALNAGGTIDFANMVWIQSDPTPLTWGNTPASSVASTLFGPTNWTNLSLGSGTVRSGFGVPAWRHDGRGRIQLRGGVQIAGSTIASGFPTQSFQLQMHVTNDYFFFSDTIPRVPWLIVGADGTLGAYWGANATQAGTMVILDGVSWRYI